MKPVDLIFPRPQELRPIEGSIPLADGLRLEPLALPNSDKRMDPALRHLKAFSQQISMPIHLEHGENAEHADNTEKGIPLRLLLDRNGPESQGYSLAIEPNGIDLGGADTAGLLYGAQTLTQWIWAHQLRHLELLASNRQVERADDDTSLNAADKKFTRLPCVRIEDHPSYRHRGVMLDISRNRVPTMETLFALVDLLASWKLNQLQLYTEHTFAYSGHETVWRGATPLTPGDVRKLDAYCRERMIELVPNQNSFGHFHRWLRHSEYRKLAECPEGVEHPFSDKKEPFSLCAVDPASLALLNELYQQLLPNFSSRLFNVGLDETFDLGLGRSREACEIRGKANVYTGFLASVRRLASQHGHRIQFWGDVVLEHSEVVSRVPVDAIALNWGYEPNHPFALECGRLAEAGLEFYVCPGTSSWNSFAGRARDAVLNLANAAVAGVEAGASGYLVTDWGDHGHLQPLPASYIGLLTGAGFAWNASTARDPMSLDLESLLSNHVFRDASGTLARSLLALANAYADTGVRIKNGTVLFHLLMSPGDDLEHPRYQNLEPAGLHRVLERMQKIRTDLAAFEPVVAAQRLAQSELVWIADALAAAARLGLARLEAGRSKPISDLPRPVRRAIQIDLDSLTHDLPRLWLERSRSGGLADSITRLRKLDLYLNLES